MFSHSQKNFKKAYANLNPLKLGVIPPPSATIQPVTELPRCSPLLSTYYVLGGPALKLALKLSGQRMESLPSKELTVDLEAGNGVVYNQCLLISKLTKCFSHPFIRLGVILQK